METPAVRKNKVGPITLALGLIALGGLLAANLGYTGVINVLKFWPLLERDQPKKRPGLQLKPLK